MYNIPDLASVISVGTGKNCYSIAIMIRVCRSRSVNYGIIVYSEYRIFEEVQFIKVPT